MKGAGQSKWPLSFDRPRVVSRSAKWGGSYLGGSSWNRPQRPNPGHLRDCWGCLGRFLGRLGHRTTAIVSTRGVGKSNCNTMKQGTAREPTTGRRARRRIATPATYGASSAEREGTTISRRGRAASEGRGRRCNRAAGNRQPPFHAFLHLHTCAFSLNSSACFLWQVTASMRRREGQARRRKRPRYTKPATHGRLLASFLASICTPIDF